MPRDVNGATQPLPGTIVSTGDTILPSQHNPMVNDVYAMITQSLSRDGQGGMRASLDMSGFRVINLGTATADTDAISLGQSRANSVPVGSTMDYAGSTAPDTWALCYGQAVSRATYADLFAAIGIVYGAGDGSTTFNLPDCRGRVVAGRDTMGGPTANRLTAYVNGALLGGTGGTDTVVLIEGQMPSHQHGGSTTVNGAHAHSLRVGGGGDGGVAGATGSLPNSNTSVDGDHSHNIVTDFRGGNQAHSNTQPTIIMNKIIKVSY